MRSSIFDFWTVPATRRAIHQKFIQPEWDQYNAETFLDIETKDEWWQWMHNVVVPNLYSDETYTSRESKKNPLSFTKRTRIHSLGKRRRSNVAVIVVEVIFISSFLFYCLLLNHSFPTNPNSITNCFKLFSLLQLYNYIAPASLFWFLNRWTCMVCRTTSVAFSTFHSRTLSKLFEYYVRWRYVLFSLELHGEQWRHHAKTTENINNGRCKRRVSIQSDAVSKCSCNYR